MGASPAALSQQARARCGDRPGRALSAAVHLWHHRPAQGSRLLAAAHRPHRQHHRRDSRSHIRRCLLSVHADVSLQCLDGRLEPLPLDGSDRSVSPQVLGLGLAGRCAQVRGYIFQLCGQAAHLHNGHPATPRRCRQPSAGSLRQRRRAARSGAFRRAVRSWRPRQLRLHRRRLRRLPHARHALWRARQRRRPDQDLRRRHRQAMPAGFVCRRRQPG